MKIVEAPVCSPVGPMRAGSEHD